MKPTTRATALVGQVNNGPLGNVSWASASPRLAGLRRLVLPAMTLAFGAYVLLHSPLQPFIAKLFGYNSKACYFVCAVASISGPALIGSIAAWLLIATVLLAAAVIAAAFDGAAYEKPLGFGVSALALLVVPAAAVGGIAAWTHTALLRPPLGPFLVMLPAAGVLANGLRRGWRPVWPSLVFRPVSPLIWLIGGLAGTLLIASIVINLKHPPTGGDGLSYHAPLAIFLWRDGNLATFLDRAPGTWALANPGTAEFWYGILQIAGGEHLANFGQLPFALLGSVAVGVFARRLGLRSGAALLGALAFLLSPLVIMQIGMQPNDVLGAAVLMSVVALASAPVAIWSFHRAVLLGLSLGLTATTKLALLPSVAAAGLFILVATIWNSGWRTPRAAWAKLAAVGLGFFIVVAPWWIRNLVRYDNPVYPAGIPWLGRGMFVSDFGTIDKEFVPHRLAWPLYPLVEPHDDRSGHGALFAVGIIPGLVLAIRRGRRQPLVIYGLVVIFMLPAWWLLTMHEPRFFLAHAGLSLAFLPWSLLGVPSPHRRWAILLIGAAALFSSLVTADQALFPFAKQPGSRLEFYDRVWGVDPFVAALPESEGLIHNTGYAPTIPEYAAYYPLLGPSQSRLVIPVDTEGTRDYLQARMWAAGVHFAYVVASPEYRETVEKLYDPAVFQQVHLSVIERGEKSGPRRYLYQSTTETNGQTGIRRYLFRLKDPVLTRATAGTHP